MLAFVVASAATGATAFFMMPTEDQNLITGKVAKIKDRLVDLAVAHGLTSCNIKGNISISTGKKIYHVPGQMFYHDTTILNRYGERWFCTEEDARAAGWRRARR